MGSNGIGVVAVWLAGAASAVWGVVVLLHNLNVLGDPESPGAVAVLAVNLWLSLWVASVTFAIVALAKSGSRKVFGVVALSGPPGMVLAALILGVALA